MAKVATAPVGLESRLKRVLKAGLKVGGIDAKVSTEPIKGTKLARVMVTSPGFKSLRPSERQNLVWRIVGNSFDQKEQLLVSMILTLTPDELAGNW